MLKKFPSLGSEELDTSHISFVSFDTIYLLDCVHHIRSNVDEGWNRANQGRDVSPPFTLK